MLQHDTWQSHAEWVGWRVSGGARVARCIYGSTVVTQHSNKWGVKDKWREVHDLFSGLSGFAWNLVSMKFHAEDEVWMDLIQSRPTAAKWRVDSIKHYDLMVELWAADRATGTGVRTARQARRQRVGPRVSVDLNQNIEYTPEQPDWTRYRDPTPPSPHPSVDEYSPGQTQSVPSVPSGGTSSSRG
ncbi:uncharacterized protein LOC128193797 [Vigna angularis]|uniref:uncharacterized protein LOC128193797 n=1 Tax=Phaseolus angularis TaxID=3914 RepID=UPI0022B44D5C|nr:uncharacterized protein LOC128193797 [Vigna angularis]